MCVANMDSSAACYAAFSGDEYSDGDVYYSYATCSDKSGDWDYYDSSVDDKCNHDTWAIEEYAPKCCSDGISVCVSDGQSTPQGDLSRMIPHQTHTQLSMSESRAESVIHHSFCLRPAVCGAEESWMPNATTR